MKPFIALAAAGIAVFSSLAMAQLPPGVTPEMIASSLPEEGAPKAVPGKYAVVQHVAPGNEALKAFHPRDLSGFPKSDTLPIVVWGNGGRWLRMDSWCSAREDLRLHRRLPRQRRARHRLGRQVQRRRPQARAQHVRARPPPPTSRLPSTGPSR